MFPRVSFRRLPKNFSSVFYRPSSLFLRPVVALYNTDVKGGEKIAKKKSWRKRSALEKEFVQIKKQHLPGGNIEKSLENLPIYKEESVFSNHFLNLAKVGVYGFDFDFVLADYKPALQRLIYDLVKEIMVKEKKYPADFLDFVYDPEFAIRGLHFDTVEGVLFKLDFVYNININTVFRGRNRLLPHVVHKMYPGLHLTQQYVVSNLRHISDLFQLSECAIIADIVQYFLDKDIVFDGAAVFRDVSDAVQQVHMKKLHEEIPKDIAAYVEKKPELGGLLAKVRSEEKLTFLLTNNNYNNVNYLMNYMMDLPPGYSTWNELFDIVVVNADKPNFFTEVDRPFRQLNEAKNGLEWSPITAFERGKVYQEGCFTQMRKLTSWENKAVLYTGDHIQNDLIDAVKHWGWRTCAIIKELDEAIFCHNSVEYRTLLSLYENVFMLHARASKQLQPTHPLIKKLEAKMKKLGRELMWIRHKNFGCVFKSGTNETVIAYQLIRFADLYSARVECLLQKPTSHKFAPQRRLMAHDISITPNLFISD